MKKTTIVGMNGEPFEYSTASELEQAGYRTGSQMDTVTISQILSSQEMPARSRMAVYQTYSYMIGDPIISTALKLHITQSLGANETTSEVVFIEERPNLSSNEKKVVEDIQKVLLPMINRCAYQLAYWAAGYGDAYARLYGKAKVGITQIEVSDFLLPPLVQPFEIAGVNAGYHLSIDAKRPVPMTNMQIARLKMPRMGFVPQLRMLHNHWQSNILDDDPANHYPLPATIGGSFCEDAERPFFMLQNALVGLNSSRILDSIRENMLGLNMEDMTERQQKDFFNAITGVLKASKDRATEAIKKREPIVEKITHIVPIFNEKQLVAVDQGGSVGATNANSYNIDDVMLYAKMLAASLGQDLSMLGFADILSGGLGDGGFFRVSAQGAQRAVLIRLGLTNLINDIIDVHCQHKYGGVFKQGERPFEINFVGAQTALEREIQETRERKAAASATMLQVFQQLKDLGFSEEAAIQFLRRDLGYDQEYAELYVKGGLMQPNQDNQMME